MIAGQDAELDGFKRNVDLVALAINLGYTFDPDNRSNSRDHTVMRSPGGSKIIVGIANGSKHWVWTDNHGEAGTAVDLVMSVKGWGPSDRKMGEVRKIIRVLARLPTPEPLLHRPPPRPSDPEAVAAKAFFEWENATDARPAVYLLKRGITESTLRSGLFRGTWKESNAKPPLGVPQKNALFPYCLGRSQIAVEQRNEPYGSPDSWRRYIGPKGSTGVWTSNIPEDRSTIRAVVWVESPIDAMSYWQMLTPEDREGLIFASIRSGMAVEEVEAVIADLPDDAVVIDAFDNDPTGDGYADIIRPVAWEFKRRFITDRPSGANDWNEAMIAQAQKPRTLTSPPPEPTPSPTPAPTPAPRPRWGWGGPSCGAAGRPRFGR